MKDKFYQLLSFKLPNHLIYFVMINGWAKVTGGKWGNTNVTTITVSEAVKRMEELCKMS